MSENNVSSIVITQCEKHKCTYITSCRTTDSPADNSHRQTTVSDNRTRSEDLNFSQNLPHFQETSLSDTQPINMPPQAPGFPLPVFASLISQPELEADLEEAGNVMNCLFSYAKCVAAASRNLLQFNSLPLNTELYPKWNELVDSTDLYASSRVILRGEPIENITREMHTLADDLKTLATGFPNLTFTEDLLDEMIGVQMMEVVWHTYDITEHNDPRVEELLDALDFPNAVIDRALDALEEANVQPVDDDFEDDFDDDFNVDEMPLPEFEVMTRELPENAETLCSICHSEMTEPVALAGCGHCFCRPCISNWVNSGEGATNKCPVCRALILIQV